MPVLGEMVMDGRRTPGPGMMRRWPAKIRLPVIPFASRIAWMLTPKRWLILYSVSPHLTT